MVVRLQNAVELLLSHTHQVGHVLGRRYLRPWALILILNLILIQLKVLNLLVDDLIGARTSDIHKIWIVELSLVLLVIS